MNGKIRFCLLIQVYEDKQLRDDLISGAKDFKQISQYTGPPCGGNTMPCHNGATCIPMLNDFVCVCTKEFTGKTCKKSKNLLPVLFFYVIFLKSTNNVPKYILKSRGFVHSFALNLKKISFRKELNSDDLFLCRDFIYWHYQAIKV